MRRTLINPILATAGSLTLISGLFLLFHYESEFTQSLHEIAAIVLVITGALHIKLNWKALKSSLKGRIIAVCAVVAACTVIMIVTGEKIDLNSLEARCTEYFEYLNK